MWHLQHNLSLIFAVFLFGCIDKELPIDPVPPGDLEIQSPSIGSNYDTQVYFSIASNEVIASNLKTDWCFAVQKQNDAVILSLNSSRFMRVSAFGEGEFSTEITEEELDAMEWQITPPEGVDQVENPFLIHPNTLYILDLGRNLTGEPIGYARLFFDPTADGLSEFRMHMGTFDLASSSTLDFDLDPAGERSHFSAIERIQKEIEPPSGSWELWLTQYTELLDGDIKYLVSGILTPSQGVKVYQAPFSDWDYLQAADWSSLTFNSQWNEIGYDWKYYDLSAGSYEVNPDIMYCIQTEEGREFLIHIIDFYDENGQTGTFTFESIER